MVEHRSSPGMRLKFSTALAIEADAWFRKQAEHAHPQAVATTSAATVPPLGEPALDVRSLARLLDRGDLVFLNMSEDRLDQRGDRRRHVRRRPQMRRWWLHG